MNKVVSIATSMMIFTSVCLSSDKVITTTIPEPPATGEGITVTLRVEGTGPNTDLMTPNACGYNGQMNAWPMSSGRVYRTSGNWGSGTFIEVRSRLRR